MKKYIIAALALIASVCTSYADDMITLYRLVVTDVDNSKISFDFSANPVVTFKENALTVELDAQNIVYAIDNVRNLTFSTYKVKKPDDGVSTIGADKSQINLAAIGSQLMATGMQPGQTLDVYTADGRLVISVVADSNGVAAVEIPSFNNGVYIAKAGNVTLKFIK